ncbi:hypothetical protein [Mesorhizobium sp.]|uniref:hypothetical protein n=1 Tax=Mesorhizobium sp. TaxID=1871066 RepID=UPI000FE4C055|nr:hypothetical protein [Mesorhizobium sp.]RWK58058.1 MAG: hypothetical protein EOR49_33315 [Mesorhizobium sp.]RWM40975.1 MAG: hypothetical protein EOR76_35195 [Mesorhizobium sp.]RWO22286.1 MAG: hypothetical protein EOS10_35125 [Mesorhizobium sp.]TIM82017.1 MAG: hypothetical protein E5Y50_30920 [Mesorhizobium sp.]
MFYHAKKRGMSEQEALDWMDHRFNYEYPSKAAARSSSDRRDDSDHTGTVGAQWKTGSLFCWRQASPTIGTMLVTWIGHRMTVASDTQKELERHGTFLAVRVASVLDPFVMGTVDIVNDRGSYVDGGELHSFAVEPTLDLPRDVDWKSIDPHLMDRILTLPNEIANAEKTFAFVGEMRSGPARPRRGV